MTGAKKSLLAVVCAFYLLAPSPATPQMPYWQGAFLADRIHLTSEQAQAIGRRIWINESGGRLTGLTHWNKGEGFASLGIAHFIWYPQGARGPFTESFSSLLSFLDSQGVALPQWLRSRPPCFWKTRRDFYASFHSARVRELRRLLEATIEHQARFTARRLEEALPTMLSALPESERPLVRARFYRVASHPNGVYALVDYVNFKGEGTSPSERYGGVGWGLLQVLQEMEETPPGPAALDAFSHAAGAVLTRRIHYSPPERRESRWLSGWRRRLSTYRLPA